MSVLVCGVLVVLQSFINCKAVSESRSTVESAAYNHIHQHILQNQEDEKFTSKVSKNKKGPSIFVSPQYSCLKNGSLPCPSWSYCDNKDGMCKCPQLSSGALSCHGFDNINLHVLDCNCVTYDEEQNQTEVGLCYYNCMMFKSKTLIDAVYHKLPSNISDWNNFMCDKFHRTGTLCGKCKDDHYLRTYSYDISCMNCTYSKYNWWKYVSSAFLPLTFFYIIILLFDINIHSSPLQGYVIYSQLLTCPPLARSLHLSLDLKQVKLHKFVKFSTSIYGIWNLDFFRMYNSGICLQIDTLVTLSLEFAVAIYPLFLVSVTYMVISLYDHKFRPLVILWSPFRALLYLFRSNWDIRTSTVDVFVTFFFLVYAKLLNACLDLLIPVQVYHFSKPEHHVNYTWRLYYDATIPYFGTAHTPFAILAIAVLLVFVLIPALVILVYPFRVCQRCFNVLPSRSQIFLRIFVDSFQGCYKDGTEVGTQDCRWFLSLFLILRFSLWSIYAYTPTAMYFLYGAMILIVLAIIIILVDPFKSLPSNYSTIMVIFILLITAFYVASIGITVASIRNDYTKFIVLLSVIVIIVVLPQIYISGIILKWLFSRRKFGLNFMRRMRAWKLGYFKLT